jgi:hypothetical protein
MDDIATAALPLPLPLRLPLPLPFDDELDAPVELRLTSRARRAVSPALVPPLRLVAGDECADARGASAPDDPTDVRPAQARALRRSGMPVPTIAAAIGADLQLVVGWTLGTEPVRRAARRAAPAGPSEASDAPGIAVVADVTLAGPLERGVARGMAVALAELDTDLGGVSFTHDRPEVLGAILDEIRRQVSVADWRTRVALRVAEQVGVDRCRSAVGAALGIDGERIVAGRWSDAPSRDALEVSLRIADGRVAELVHGWTGALAVPAEVDRAAG